MPLVAEKEARAGRLEIRLTPSVKALLTHAANVRHCSLTEFLLSSAVRAAEEAVNVAPRVPRERGRPGRTAPTVRCQP